ncbi:hypothetical protein GCM10028803_48300 [Larkinella knui]|uniref:Uncharacterized protein n=1 Tax=Larkinella knui TaxID=2025310 RepID=A0A3P1CQ61_9BACT|nr:hypothetical protein [Larkinella knui]RRB15405.1 hypothetical protein EHT87_12815 [Larkinella knui]
MNLLRLVINATPADDLPFRHVNWYQNEIAQIERAIRIQAGIEQVAESIRKYEKLAHDLELERKQRSRMLAKIQSRMDKLKAEIELVNYQFSTN